MPTPLSEFPQSREAAPAAEQLQQPQQQANDFQTEQTEAPRDTSHRSIDREMDFRASDEALPASETGELGGTPPPAGDKTPKMVPLAALEDERAKRKEFEDKFNELRTAQPAQQPQAQPQTQQYELPDPLDDPEGFKAAVIGEARATAKSDILAMSVEMQRELHKDYPEMENAFVEAAKADPQLQARFRASPNPGAFVYNEGKRYTEAKELREDPAKARERIAGELRQEITDQVLNTLREQGVIPANGQPRPRFPQAMGTGRSVMPRSNPGFSGPTPLSAFPGPGSTANRRQQQ